MNEKLSLLVILLLLFSGCHNEKNLNSKIVKLNEINIDDSKIVNQIMSNNLLFNKTYSLIDSVSKFIIFGKNNNEVDQNQIINKLIKFDSIPNKAYKLHENSSKEWLKKGSHTVIKSDTLNKIFEDPYIISGKIDNYKIHKGRTGNDGFTYISNVYYSENYTNAIVGVFMLCGWNCGQSHIRYYKKVNSDWSLQMTYVMSES